MDRPMMDTPWAYEPERKPSKWDAVEGESREELEQRQWRMKIMSDVLRRDRIKPDDPLFEEKVSQYLTGPVDPSIAVHSEVDLPENVGINKYGWHNDTGKDVEFTGVIDWNPIAYTAEDGKLGAVHTMNTPFVYGHEYRHKNRPELSERNMRNVDLVAAQTPYDVDQAIRSFANIEGGLPSESLPAVSDMLRSMEIGPMHGKGKENRAIAELSGRDVSEVIDESAMMSFVKDAADLEEYNEGLSYRNEKRRAGEPESYADVIRELLEKMGI